MATKKPAAAQRAVYGLFEVFAATCNESLTSNRIHHDLFVARDEEHAQQLATERSGGLLDITITRLADVTPRVG